MSAVSGRGADLVSNDFTGKFGYRGAGRLLKSKLQAFLRVLPERVKSQVVHSCHVNKVRWFHSSNCDKGIGINRRGENVIPLQDNDFLVEAKAGIFQ